MKKVFLCLSLAPGCTVTTAPHFETVTKTHNNKTVHTRMKVTRTSSYNLRAAGQRRQRASKCGENVEQSVKMAESWSTRDSLGAVAPSGTLALDTHICGSIRQPRHAHVPSSICMRICWGIPRRKKYMNILKYDLNGPCPPLPSSYTRAPTLSGVVVCVRQRRTQVCSSFYPRQRIERANERGWFV